jgi:hypothetical protein
MQKPSLLIVGIIIFYANLEAPADCPEFFGVIQSGTVKSNMLAEISGIAASRKNSDVLWVHNDSGDAATVYAMDIEGNHLRAYSLSGANAVDWEDMAIGPGPEENEDYLYLGDIGDNWASRSNIVVYRVQEPRVGSNQLPVTETLSGVERLRLAYPDGARDAETLMLDPLTKDMYIISKRETNSRIYVARYPQSTSEVTVMEYKGQLPWGWTTGGDISVEGSLVIVRGYLNASVWRRIAGMEIWEAFETEECIVPIVIEPQGEAICFDGEGCGYYTVSEGAYRPIHYFGRDGECPLEGDVNGDGNIGLLDMKIFADHWLDFVCGGANSWCEKCDLDKSGGVDLVDFAYLGEDWGK